MMDRFNFLAILGILISVLVSFYDKLSVDKLAIVVLVIILFCYLILLIENKLSKLNKRWLDSIFFIFTKRESPFVILERDTEYCILDEKNATYEESNHVKSLKCGAHQTFTSRYAWDQEEPIDCSRIEDDVTIREEGDLKWTKVHITKESYIDNRKNWNAGFKLKNLKITNYKKKSYISIKVIDKIKSLKMSIKVNESLNFNKKAKLYVEDYIGREIGEPEEIEYDSVKKCFFKELRYPRKGRKYIIKVFYD